jgi:hypothetical protein
VLRKRSKSAERIEPESGASILEAKTDGVSEAAPKGSTRANRSPARKSTRKQGLSGKTKAAKKSTPVSAAEAVEAHATELQISDQVCGPTVAEDDSAGKPLLSSETSIQERIALLAYSYWETRGRHGGSPEEDWFRAERELRKNLELRSSDN